MKIMTFRNLLLALALVLGAPLALAGSTSQSKSFCAPKKKKNNNRNNNNRNNNNRNSKPRVVGKRTGNLPPLSSKAPKNIQTKPYEPPAQVGPGLKTYAPKKIRSIRIVGKVQRTVETRINPQSRLEEDVEGYSIETSLGSVPLTMRALQRGGQVIDLAPYVGHRIRVTGDAYFKDERAQSGLRYEAIRRIETE